MIVPQVSFLFGIQVLLVRFGIDGTWFALIWIHMVFVLPYVILILAGPFRRLDPRFETSARALGAGPTRVLWRVVLPILLRPLALAAALGIAVSVALYPADIVCRRRAVRDVDHGNGGLGRRGRSPRARGHGDLAGGAGGHRIAAGLWHRPMAADGAAMVPGRLSGPMAVTRHRLELFGVSLSVAGARLFAPLTFTIAAGEVLAVMGPSGSGKSSLLAHICGTLPTAFEAEGSVSIDGTDIGGLPAERRGVGILFQDGGLFPHMSVAENLAFGLEASVHRRSERRRRVESALADAELVGFGDRDPATLSGGQRTRVALMRTLLSEPRILLLDEPFSGLDLDLRSRLRAFIFDRVAKEGLPTLLVTHDPADAAAAGGKRLLLRRNQAPVGADPGST